MRGTRPASGSPTSSGSIRGDQAGPKGCHQLAAMPLDRPGRYATASAGRAQKRLSALGTPSAASPLHDAGRPRPGLCRTTTRSMPITIVTRSPHRQPRPDHRADQQAGAQGIAYREPRSVPPDRLAGRVGATTRAFLRRSTRGTGHVYRHATPTVGVIATATKRSCAVTSSSPQDEMCRAGAWSGLGDDLHLQRGLPAGRAQPADLRATELERFANGSACSDLVAHVAQDDRRYPHSHATRAVCLAQQV